MTIRPERIVLLGANGMLGSEIRCLCANNNLTALDLPQFDITDTNQLEKAVENADVVINCAAYTNVEKAASESEQAFKVNAEAVGNLAQLARKNNIYVIHISTDFVFDGEKKTPYLETDKTNPINIYGKSKLEGETLLAKNHNNFAIIRVQWTYGKNGANFITKLVSPAKQKDVLKVVDDQFGSPTSTQEAAKAIVELAAKRPQGIFHYAAAGFASRYDAAKFAFEKLKLNTKILPCKSDEFPTAAKRPLNSRFCCDKIQALLDKPIEEWQRPLERFLETI
ncbi:MAG: dTDP-4-dehydrorhamnose reductase [Planctomycetes bacterium HGW-Planctomycetes-1]|nr:MAG: dTDP-4-dehydrorhamnose reductase [Planctomycetes bacterium HGW-Planctomycetes-1]